MYAVRVLITGVLNLKSFGIIEKGKNVKFSA
jgi:hypothetical protein